MHIRYMYTGYILYGYAGVYVYIHIYPPQDSRYDMIVAPLQHGDSAGTAPNIDGHRAVCVCLFRSMSGARRPEHLHIRCSIVVSISACHAEDPGSIPGGGV